MKPAPPAARVLPLSAVRQLQQAAATPDPFARQIAIEKATERIQQLYPHHFRKDFK
jgi:hypothetical protein